ISALYYLSYVCSLTGQSTDSAWRIVPYICPLSSVLRRLFYTCDIIRQIQNLLIGDRRDDVGHRRIVTVARIVLVAAQRLDQIILALGADARNVLLAGKIRQMAEVAAVLLDQNLGALHAGVVHRTGGGLRRRQLRNDVGETLQIGVGQALGHVVHRIGEAHLFAEHQELDRDIERLLAAERRHAVVLRLAVLAVAGEAGRQPLLHQLLRRRRQGGEISKRQNRDEDAHQTIASWSMIPKSGSRFSDKIMLKHVEGEYRPRPFRQL